MTTKPKRRWYRFTPDRFIVGLLAVEGFLLLSERLRWFAFNEKKGFTVLVAVAAGCLGVLFLLLWFAVSLLLRRRFQFGVRSLLVLVLVVTIAGSWLAVTRQQVRRQREAVEAIENIGGLVTRKEPGTPGTPPASAAMIAGVPPSGPGEAAQSAGGAPTSSDPATQMSSSAGGVWPTGRAHDERIERIAIAHLLRSSEVQRAILGTDNPVDPADALLDPAGQAVAGTAVALFARDGRLPEDPEVWGAAVEQFLRDTDQWVPEARGLVDELLVACYGPEIGVISPARGREAWADLIVERALMPRMQAGAVSATPAAITLSMDEITRLWDWVRRLREGSGARRRLRAYSVRELWEEARPPEWHVQHVLVRGATAFVAGPFKSIKSGVLLDMAVCLAMPSTDASDPRWLGRFPVQPARHVLFCTGEAELWETKEKIRAIYSAKTTGLAVRNRQRMADQQHPACALRMKLFFEPPQMALEEDQRIIAEKIRQHEAEVVIFDPLYLSLLAGTDKDTDARNIFEMGRALRAMEEVVKDKGATPILAHHFVKSVRIGEEPSLGHMAYAGSAERAAQWILLNHRVPFDPSNGHARLTMLFGGRAGQAGAYGVDIVEGRVNADFTGWRWEASVTSLEEARDRDREEGLAGSGRRRDGSAELRRRILTYMSNLTAPGSCICASPLADAVSASHAKCGEALRQLVEQQLVAEVTATRGGREYTAYQLTPAGRLEAQRQRASESGPITFDPDGSSATLPMTPPSDRSTNGRTEGPY